MPGFEPDYNLPKFSLVFALLPPSPPPCVSVVNLSTTPLVSPVYFRLYPILGVVLFWRFYPIPCCLVLSTVPGSLILGVGGGETEVHSLSVLLSASPWSISVEEEAQTIPYVPSGECTVSTYNRRHQSVWVHFYVNIFMLKLAFFFYTFIIYCGVGYTPWHISWYQRTSWKVSCFLWLCGF